MIKLTKPKFWDKKIGYISIILFPFSLIYIYLNYLRKKFTVIKKFQIPIICVGNIYIGGTGKTPTSIFLANELNKLNKKTVILRKFYKNHKDEYSLIRKKFNNLIVRIDRLDAINEAEKSRYDVAILDDGLQDYRIQKTLNIVCFHSNQLIGNGLVLPSGPLREKLSNLKNAEIVLINGGKNKNFESKILNINNKLEIFYSFYKPLNLYQFRNKKLLAIAGIGNPENFFQLLTDNNLEIYKKIIFPDHYEFSKKEIENILNEAENKGCQIIMTEKDYFKVQNYKLEKINYLKVSLEIKNKEKFLKKVGSL
ncbi:tetraacyldisaccharide 4'-kinase [Candidatus Pelagibacter bacterium]|nr:tetraacyldisaccharide 4'-kinase [Candidatus Pelagibacter bacterium]MDA9619022.1 tetraacyldisaccharide 4'-kinase [Candidatus Pelagibacter bacterium]